MKRLYTDIFTFRDKLSSYASANGSLTPNDIPNFMLVDNKRYYLSEEGWKEIYDEILNYEKNHFISTQSLSTISEESLELVKLRNHIKEAIVEADKELYTTSTVCISTKYAISGFKRRQP
jgi:hypothetical protein